MSKLRLSVMNGEISSGLSCGVDSIDNLMKNAYAKLIFKQGLAYNIFVDGHLVGNCMMKFVHLIDEDVETYVQNPDFTALEISYIAIDYRLQHHGIGSQVLNILIQRSKTIAAYLPVRFLVIDAFENKAAWYTKAGFKEYPKAKDTRYPGTVPMRMDLINLEEAENYIAPLVEGDKNERI